MSSRSFLVAWVLVLWADSGVGAQVVRELEGHRAAIYALAFHPDGEHLATASLDHTLKLWKRDSGELVQTLTGHRDKVLTLAFSPDGQRLASAGLDGVVRLWDLSGPGNRSPGLPVSRSPGLLVSEGSCIHSLAFSPDGKRLVCAGEDGLAEVWDVEQGKLLLTLPSLHCAIYSAAVSADGREVALGCGASAPQARSASDGTVPSLALRACGASGQPTHRIYLFDLQTGEQRQVLEGHHEPVYSLAFAPDGTLVSGSEDRTVQLWDVAAGKPLLCLNGHREAVYQVAFSGDGRRLVSAGTDGEVIVWDSRTGRALHTHRFPGKTLCTAFTQDGRAIGAGTGQARCYLLELPRHVR